MRFSYYPGCTLHSTGAEYGESTRAVFEALGVELVELPDWSCCGATSAHSMDRDLAVLLAGRNLAIAQQTGMGLVVPCAACYGRLKYSQQALQESRGLRRRLESALGIPWAGGVVVEPALVVVADRVGKGELAARIRLRLDGLRVAPYYGCLLARPQSVTGEPNPDRPTSMDLVLSLLGAEVTEWSYRTDCCGGSLTLSRGGVVARLVGKLVDRAVEAGAECIATACPMCHANLEMRQHGRKLPVFYFTELMGLAFSLPEAGRWWGKHLIDPRPLLRSRELVATDR